MVRGLVALCLLCVLAPSASALDARKCGKAGSRCEVLAQGLENARSISRIQPDGSFFVGTAGNAQTDLCGELISERNTDSSAIYRYTQAGGLQPWIGCKPSPVPTAVAGNSLTNRGRERVGNGQRVD